MTEPEDSPPAAGTADPGEEADESPLRTLWARLRGWRRPRDAEDLRESLEELIGDQEAAGQPISDDERLLLSNVLQLRARTVEDVMVPRADIIAIEIDSPLDEVLKLLTAHPRSRIPVYRKTSDDVVGLLNIKDILLSVASSEPFDIKSNMRPTLFIAPSMPVMDLLLEMRRSRIHLALVVDEFGGIDGLVTIEDLVEEITGEIQDEHESHEEPELTLCEDGSVLADARATLEDFEALAGVVATDEEREEIDTLGGLVVALAGRVPGRGEVVSHPNGLVITVLDADPRRVKRVRAKRGVPATADEEMSGLAAK